jgi:hypothetical protein
MKAGLFVMLTASAAAAAGPELHVVHLQPSGGELAVREIFLFRNDRPSPRGALRFFVPEAAQGLRVVAQRPPASPVEQQARRTGGKGEYVVEAPVEPGETRIDVSYAVPLGQDRTFSGKTFHPETPLRLVAPRGFALEGEGLEALGEDPGSQASIYGAGKGEYRVRIVEAEAAGEGPGIQQILPQTYDNLPWILAPVCVVLLLWFVLNYLKGAAAAGGGERRP